MSARTKGLLYPKGLHCPMCKKEFNGPGYPSKGIQGIVACINHMVECGYKKGAAYDKLRDQGAVEK